MLHVKALYNLIRITEAQEPGQSHAPWATEDLRSVAIDTLWERLRRGGVSLSPETFSQFVEECDTPEQLAELVLPDEKDPSWLDQHYLLLFELWRRLFPEKQSLSLFCDELDHRIALYDAGELSNDEQIQDALANLQEILEENADAGADPQEIFQAISEYCAHDLELFIFDRISEVLDQENYPYASELLDGFAPYVMDGKGFTFLRIRLLAVSDRSEANLLLAALLKKELELPLLLEMLRFLAGNGDRALFLEAARKASPFLETEEEFQEVLSFAAEYYRRLDQETLEKRVQNLMQRGKDLSAPLDPQDQDLMSFMSLINESRSAGSEDNRKT